ncbi:hypothetical protein ABZ930_11830 [Streptomyces sp. NPDC046716]|uniref:hypothetical protein n=1 Tax=Streptomyces sp. NPDC046716 TaxID=3157093 RepID=UPI0033F89BAF
MTDDTPEAWHARLGWTYGLLAENPAQRATALAQLDAARARVEAALDQVNARWFRTRRLGPDGQYRNTGFRRALDAYRRATEHSLPGGLWGTGPWTDITIWPGLPYALVFLEWEARHPQEWTERAKAWGTKQSLIRALAVTGHTEPVRAQLTELVELAVLRAYRCKDREYIRVARAVDSPDLRARLARAAASDEPWARTHAGYVLWALDHPGTPAITRHAWRAWLSGTPDCRCPAHHD